MKAISYGIIPYLFTEDGVAIMLSKSSSGMEAYDFVKGKIEEDETPIECCCREVYEEIGIVIQGEDLEELVIQKNPKKDIGLYFINWGKYIYDVMELDNDEIYSITWFNISDLPEVSKNQRLILTRVLERFNKLNYTQRKKYDNRVNYG